jgi:hypothetical protein
MIMFDASNRDQCEVKRLQTNTPLQALIMMNDPAVLEASRVLAQNLQQGNSAAVEKISTAFRRIICRKPSAEEVNILVEYYNDQLEQFKNKKLNALVTLKIGEYPLNEKADMNQTAALMKTVNTIYNLEEAIVK